MDIVGNVKEIADLAKKYNDIEFYRKIVHLEGEVIELTRENRQAEQKIEELQTQLALKIKIRVALKGKSVAARPRRIGFAGPSL